MSMFHVGQRVVFIGPDGSELYKSWGVKFPVKGCVYTIREIGPFNMTVLLLEEIHNPPYPGTTYEGGFGICFFRPVRDTSIEVFRKLLAPLPEKEDA